MSGMICQPSKLIVLQRKKPESESSMRIKSSNGLRKRLLNRTYILVSLPSGFHLR